MALTDNHKRLDMTREAGEINHGKPSRNKEKREVDTRHESPKRVKREGPDAQSAHVTHRAIRAESQNGQE